MKCIIWDLDNTLWNGVLLENDKVTLNSTSIELLKAAYEKGIVQSICSKNDYEKTITFLEKCGLKSYFIYPQISFEPKSINIKIFIDGLHIKEDDIVFIDDDIFEREEVKSVFKHMAVYSVEDIPKILYDVQKKTVTNTSVDKNRLLLYKDEERRLERQGQYTDISGFLMKSDFRVKVKIPIKSDLPRISELIQRTHQLNTTGYYFSEKEILRHLEETDWFIRLFYVEDKYGSYGDSALIIAEQAEQEFHVKMMIISCRLINKGVSTFLLHYAAEKAIESGCLKLFVDFLENRHNRALSILLTMNGLKVIKDSIDGKIYGFNMDLSNKKNQISKPEWIHYTDCCRVRAEE